MRILVIIILFVVLQENTYSENIRYIDLRTKNFTIGISPSIGGRIYKLNSNNSHIIAWDETLLYNWHRKDHYPYHLFGGQELWLSPQENWQKKWPPDLTLSTDNWLVIKESNSEIMLRSQRSKQGLIATRQIKLINENCFENLITIKNDSKQDLELGIWLLTRVKNNTKIYLPNAAQPKHDKSSLQASGEHPNFSKLNYKPASEKKLSYNCNIKTLLLKHEQTTWQLTISYSHQGEIHPSHSQFEFYPIKKLLEVEHHGPFIKLKPGDEIWCRETWTKLK